MVEREDRNVSDRVTMREYDIWTNEDKHSEAYRNLLSKDEGGTSNGQQIAERLGHSSATDPKAGCIQWHFSSIDSPVTEENRIKEGVGCEACHGPSRDWNQPHNERDEWDRTDAEGRTELRAGSMYIPQRSEQSCVCHVTWAAPRMAASSRTRCLQPDILPFPASKSKHSPIRWGLIGNTSMT